MLHWLPTTSTNQALTTQSQFGNIMKNNRSFPSDSSGEVCSHCTHATQPPTYHYIAGPSILTTNCLVTMQSLSCITASTSLYLPPQYTVLHSICFTFPSNRKIFLNLYLLLCPSSDPSRKITTTCWMAEGVEIMMRIASELLCLLVLSS